MGQTVNFLHCDSDIELLSSIRTEQATKSAGKHGTAVPSSKKLLVRRTDGSAVPSNKELLVHRSVQSLNSMDNRVGCRKVFESTTFPAMVADLPVLFVLFLAISLTMLPSTLAFNIDVERAFVIRGANDSMFGFAVAQHIDQSINWLLIGAPTAQTSQRGVIRGGAVFRCKTDTANSCQEIPFDDTGNEVKYSPRSLTYLQTEEKSGQWFGSTLRSSGESGIIVACAPRYMYFSETQDKQEPVGVCYLAKSSTTRYDKYSPCANGPYGFNNQGFCQAGTSAALTHDGRRLLIGAPGSWYWQGRMFNYKTENGGDLVGTTGEGKPIEDDTYKGYSSAVGEFDGEAGDDYVVGIPKGDYYAGKVQFLTQSMTSLGFIDGEQIGSYFGYALAVTDLNGDRMDDLIVGAPMYADLDSTDTYDTGRVYIYYQSTNADDPGKPRRVFSTQTRDTLDGQSSNSRFGLALSSLGDINYDGYNDLVVGAPYAGENKKGAIYIYHGSKKGIITKVSQIIFAKDIETSLSAFGISVSGGLDQDGNSYPDLLVGAYTSDRAVFLRTKPVVRVYASLKLDPEMINLDSDSCALPDNTRAPCLTVYTCIEYVGVGVPEELDLDVTLTLDVKDSNTSVQEQRAYFTGAVDKFIETKTQTLKKKDVSCTNSYAYVKKEPYDKLSPIKVTMDFKLNNKRQPRQVRSALPPILDDYILTTTSFTAQILKDCGIDNKCIPDLAVSYARVPREHKIGSLSPLELMLIVFNYGEDSYNTNLWIDLPPGVAYKTITNQRANVAVSCDALKTDSSKVVCGLGNPMQRNSESEFTLVLTPTNTNNTQNRLVFNLFVNSTNPENSNTYENNQKSFEIPVTIDEPQIVLYGVSSPNLIVLNVTEDKGEERGRDVKHVFQLKNEALYAIKETELQIKWPSHDRKGNPVLLIDKPLMIEGSGTCKVIILTPKNASSYAGLGNIATRVEFNQERNRFKREAGVNVVSCSDSYCTIIQCQVGYLAPTYSFILTVQSNLMVTSFIKRREATEMYNITAVAFAKVKSVPFDLVPVDTSRFGIKSLEVVTQINTDLHKPASKGVQIWVIALAVTAGLLALLLLILLLWWCGFFKRKKPMEEGYFVVNGKSVDNTVAD